MWTSAAVHGPRTDGQDAARSAPAGAGVAAALEDEPADAPAVLGAPEVSEDDDGAAGAEVASVLDVVARESLR